MSRLSHFIFLSFFCNSEPPLTYFIVSFFGHVPILSLLYFQSDCAIVECDYDGGDCSLGFLKMWQQCREPKDGIACYNVYNNSQCNEACNNPSCLFDGWDCVVTAPCNPSYNQYCEMHYKNGHCDAGCNTTACNWDGGDCNKKTNILPGSMVLIVMKTPAEFLRESSKFLRNLGQLLQVIVKIKLSETGQRMVYPWTPSADDKVSRPRRYALRSRRSVPDTTEDDPEVVG